MRTGETNSVSDVEITGFRPDDYDAVRRLWERSGLCVRPSDERDAVLLKLSRDPDLFLVARRDGVMAGVVMGAWDGRRAYVYHLAVDPDVQRRGVASALMDELERRLVAKGALKIKLQIMPGNKVSWAFFKGRGYLIEAGLTPVGKELVEGGAPMDWGAPVDPSLE